MMKIAFCAHDGKGEFGGVATWIADLAPALQRQGHDVHVMAFVRDDAETPLLDHLRECHISVATFSHWSPFHERVKWLTSAIEREQIQVLIPNYLMTAFCAARQLRSTGLQVVAVLHSDDPTYHCIMNGVANHSVDFPVDRIVAVSKTLCEKAKTVFDEQHVYRIPCGIPLSNRKAKFSNHGMRIIYAGRIMQYQKRILDTVRAACATCRQFPQVTVDFYGDGSEIGQCQQIVEAAGLGDRMRFAGFCKPEEVRQALPDCQAFVLLSDFEGLPVALLEAMSAGVVPICSRIKSGIPELVQDGVSGILIDDREQGLTDAVGRLVEHPEWWTKLSCGAQAAVAEFSLDVCAAKWGDVIRSLSDKPTRPTLRDYWPWHGLPKRYHGFEWDDMREPLWEERWEKRWRGVRNRLRRYARALRGAHE